MYVASSGHCVACGSLPRDAELRQVGAKNSSCTSFGIKVDEIGAGDAKQAKWLDCVAWHKLAKYAAGLEKGDVVFVAGKFRKYSYTSKKTGELVEKTELVCEFIMVQSDQTDELLEENFSKNENNFEKSEENCSLPF